MKTLLFVYLTGIQSMLREAENFPARVEKSPVRAMRAEDSMVVTVQPGAESVDTASGGRSTRIREIHLVAHTSGDEHLESAEQILGAAHPLIMNYAADGIVAIAEHGTDEPKYANGDLTRQVVTKRYRITYQTDEHSLEE